MGDGVLDLPAERHDSLLVTNAAPVRSAPTCPAGKYSARFPLCRHRRNRKKTRFWTLEECAARWQALGLAGPYAARWAKHEFKELTVSSLAPDRLCRRYPLLPETDRDMGIATDLLRRPCPRSRNPKGDTISPSFNFWLVVTPKDAKISKFLITSRFCLPGLLWNGSLSEHLCVRCDAKPHRRVRRLRSNDVIGAPGSTK